ILKLFPPLRIQPAIIGASRNQDTFCVKHRGATFRLETGAVLAISVVLQGEGRGWCGKFRAESVSLKLSEPGQFAATNAGRESKEVFDEGRGTGLSAGRITFQNDCLQSLGCGIHRCSQAGWSSANNREVAENFGFTPSPPRPHPPP